MLTEPIDFSIAEIEEMRRPRCLQQAASLTESIAGSYVSLGSKIGAETAPRRVKFDRKDIEYVIREVGSWAKGLVMPARDLVIPETARL